MKAFEKFEEVKFDYPEDMKIIMDYLNNHGQLNIKPKTVEKMYREFSDCQYYAKWMSIVDGEGWIDLSVLEQFANYLSKIDL